MDNVQNKKKPFDFFEERSVVCRIHIKIDLDGAVEKLAHTNVEHVD